MPRKYGPILLGLGAVACGSAPPRVASIPPVSVHEAAGQSTRRPSAGDSAPGEDAPESLDLRQFRPLLASAHLASIRQKMEEQHYEAAAEELRAWMDQEMPTGLDRARFSFLLGSLYRLSGEPAEAIGALGPAVDTEWVLQGDAELLLAEMALLEERWQQALDLTARTSDASLEARTLSVRAAALSGLGRDQEALPLLTRLTELRLEAADRLRLAECLLRLAEASEGAADEGATKQRRLLLASRALREARLSAVGYPDASPVGRAAARVASDARKWGAREEEGRDELLLVHATKLVDARLWEEAAQVTAGFAVPSPRVWDGTQCQLDYLKAKILAGQREWGKGADRLRGAAEHCAGDPELHAKILFNAGKFSAADSRNTAAASYYEKLEELYPTDSLADDSRVRRARAYLDAGVVARFTELLLALPEDYPDGDMTMEGVLELALYRIERSDWAGASIVLERGARAIGKRDVARGQEESGRERYFWARSLAQLGNEDAALSEYERIVRELPLSYYMLHAYSRLKKADSERATRALNESLELAREQPFSFPYRSEFDSPRFRRGMELLRVGDLQQGRMVLSSMGLGETVDDSLLWGLALLYDRAGDAHVSHGIARGRLTDWLSHYPEGDWKRPWEIGFPRPYHDIVERESGKTGVPEWFIYGVMREESTFDARVVSHADAYGLMQLIIPTARAFAKREGMVATPTTLKRPSVNIALGSRVLESLTDRFKENPWLAIPGYNAGPGRPARWMRERSDVDFDVWVELIPFRETRRYTKRVLASRAAYAFVYYRESADVALSLPERLEVR